MIYFILSFIYITLDKLDKLDGILDNEFNINNETNIKNKIIGTKTKIHEMMGAPALQIRFKTQVQKII